MSNSDISLSRTYELRVSFKLDYIFSQNYSYRVPKGRTGSSDSNLIESNENKVSSSPINSVSQSATTTPTRLSTNPNATPTNRKALSSYSSQSVDDEQIADWTPEIPFENVSNAHHLLA
jgi:hypothetical protein